MKTMVAILGLALLLLPAHLAAQQPTASITFEMTQAQLARVVDAFTAAFAYPVQVPDPNNTLAMIPNPLTREQFTKRMIWAHVQDITKRAEEAEQRAAISVPNIEIEIE